MGPKKKEKKKKNPSTFLPVKRRKKKPHIAFPLEIKGKSQRWNRGKRKTGYYPFSFQSRRGGRGGGSSSAFSLRGWEEVV